MKLKLICPKCQNFNIFPLLSSSSYLKPSHCNECNALLRVRLNLLGKLLFILSVFILVGASVFMPQLKAASPWIAYIIPPVQIIFLIAILRFCTVTQLMEKLEKNRQKEKLFLFLTTGILLSIGLITSALITGKAIIILSLLAVLIFLFFAYRVTK
ncbi:MAG: hypothetical protein KAG61_08375 [Bacteriovoracaceae bacterium]|nr:hypothetical protein [Bacteriovoracaceae bacterium]